MHVIDAGRVPVKERPAILAHVEDVVGVLDQWLNVDIAVDIAKGNTRLDIGMIEDGIGPREIPRFLN